MGAGSASETPDDARMEPSWSVHCPIAGGQGPHRWGREFDTETWLGQGEARLFGPPSPATQRGGEAAVRHPEMRTHPRWVKPTRSGTREQRSSTGRTVGRYQETPRPLCGI